MKKLKVLFFAIAMSFSITSCLEDKPLENDVLQGPQSLASMQNEFVKATGGNNPMTMKVGEWAYFRNYAKTFTGNYFQTGFKSAEVFAVEDGSFEWDDDDGHHTHPTKKWNIVLTDYGPIKQEGDPAPVVLQKEWKCTFLNPDYYLWIGGDCPLPMIQDFWVFFPISEPEKPIFFSLAKYSQREKLPEIMVKEGRCYDFKDCEIEVNYLEYDIAMYSDGEYVRYHYFTSFSPDLPYLASNNKQCLTTLYEHEGQKIPAQVCQELIDFRPEL